MNTDNQMLLLVDEYDNFSGEYAKRIDCHTGNGIRHRAFVTLLENEKGEVLLQKRKHSLWDNFWDITATTHVLHLDNHNESYNEAAKRVLKTEMGIVDTPVTNVGGFTYFVKLGDKCENEYCAILTGSYNGAVQPSDAVIYEYQWLDKKTFINNCLSEDQTYTPWAILTGKFIAKH